MTATIAQGTTFRPFSTRLIRRPSREVPAGLALARPHGRWVSYRG